MYVFAFSSRQSWQRWRCHRWWRLWSSHRWQNLHRWHHRLRNVHRWGIFTGEIAPGGDILGLRYLINLNSGIFSSITHNNNIWRQNHTSSAWYLDTLGKEGVWCHVLTASPVVTGDTGEICRFHRWQKFHRWGSPWQLCLKSSFECNFSSYPMI